MAAAADHYELLGFPRFAPASAEEVETAREKTRRLLAEWGDGQSAALAVRVEEASRVLSDGALREEYDSGLRRQVEAVRCLAETAAADHYELLGLPRFEAASVQEIEAAREKTLHLFAEWGDGQSAVLAARVKEAARVLSHPGLRQVYDVGLQGQLSGLAAPLEPDGGDENKSEKGALGKRGDE